MSMVRKPMNVINIFITINYRSWEPLISFSTNSKGSKMLVATFGFSKFASNAIHTST